MCAHVNNSVDIQYLCEIGIEGHKTVMRRSASCHHQAHRISLKTKSRLDSNKNVSEHYSLDQQIAAKCVDRSRSRSPIALNLMHIRTKPPVLRHIHSISHICRRAKSLGVATEYPLSQFIRSLGELNGIPFALKSLQNIPETGKNIEICCGCLCFHVSL